MKEQRRRFGPVIRWDGYRFHFAPGSGTPGAFVPMDGKVWLQEVSTSSWSSHHRRIMLYNHRRRESDDYLGHADACEDCDRSTRSREAEKCGTCRERQRDIARSRQAIGRRDG